MKTIIIKITATLILFLLAGNAFAQNGKAALTGVWKYEWEGWEGIAIISPSHFIWLLTGENRQAFASPTPSASEKAKSYDALITEAGTWELESDKRVKTTRLYASNPDMKKTPFFWDFERAGSAMTAWIIQPDGSRGAPIKSRKLADWSASGNISMFHGVWEYVGQYGMYLQAGNYGAWFILNGAQSEASTDEGKAKNFDALNSSVAVGTHLGGNRYVWNVIHSKDPRNEKDAYFTDCDMSNPDMFKMWFIDAMGTKVGGEWQVKRIGR